MGTGTDGKGAIMRNVFLLAGILSLAVTGAQALEYNFETDTEGWTASVEATGAANLTVANGALGLDYITPTGPFDPMLVSPAISLPANTGKWLVVEVDLTAAPGAGPQQFQLFYANELGGFSEGRSRTFNVQPNAGIQRIVLDMTASQPARDPWQGTVTQVRMDPGRVEADLVGYHCDVHSFALTDDTDNDGIPDDYEYTNYGDLASIGAEALPAGSAGLLAALMALAGAGALVRRKTGKA